LIEGDQDAKGQSSLDSGCGVVFDALAGKNRLVYLTAFSSLLPLVPPSLLLSELNTVSD
jgi:hypothetical protein